MLSPSLTQIFLPSLVTARNSSCGKVIFSQACVIPSVHGEGGVYPSMQWGCVSQHAMGHGVSAQRVSAQRRCLPRGVSAQGVCLPRGVSAMGCVCHGGVSAEGVSAQGRHHPWHKYTLRDSHCSGRYASY